MPKLGPVFLIATTAIILLSFGALCYLMRTVNPKPVKNPENSRRYNPIDTSFVNEIFLPSDNLDYGLERISNSDIITMNSTKYPYPISMYHFFSSGTAMQSIVPLVSPDINSTQTVTNSTNEENKQAVTEAMSLPMRGQRRSIKDDDKLNHIEIPSSLILNIVDNNGIPKIVISMGAKRLNKRKSRKRSSSNKTKSYDLERENSIENSSTIVIIELNDSVGLNLIGDSIDSDDFNDVESVILKNELELNNKTLNSREFFESDLTSINGTKREIFEKYSNDDSSSFDLSEVEKNEAISTVPNANINNFDFKDNLTLSNSSSTEGIHSENDNKPDVTNTIALENIDGITNMNNDRLVDLLIREETLKDVLVQENDPLPITDNVNTFQ